MTFITRPSVSSPTGTSIGPAEVDGLHAPGQAVGGMHGHAADLVLAEVLLDLDDDVHGDGRLESFAGDPDGGVDLGQLHVL